MPKLTPPPSGITVRMYRQGHGDCFLLATRRDDGKPFYMVIDCGLWTGSEVEADVTMERVVKDIAVSTGRQVDVLLITHEHMDHVSGFAPRGREGKGLWDDIEIGEIWLAWTEDRNDPDAEALRKRFDDVLFGLAGALEGSGRLGLAAGDPRTATVRDVLALHTGETRFEALANAGIRREFGLAPTDDAALAATAGMSNKVAIKRMRDQAGRACFLSPGGNARALPGVAGLRVFALGPPRDAELLLSLNPKGGEEFKFGIDGSARPLLESLARPEPNSPFDPRFGASPDNLDGTAAAFFERHYGTGAGGDPEEWRRIDDDWGDAAESLALRLNDEVNNTSLVIAIELPETRKVLLFTGDAQRGSWMSWGDLEWETGDGRVSARDLLGRVVFLKVGHHGSHNATLNGTANSDYANLGWLGRERFGDEFVAMIPANKRWAEAKRPKPWLHPLKAIEETLRAKADGRVLRMDESTAPPRPEGVGEARWQTFARKVAVTELYMQYTVTDR